LAKYELFQLSNRPRPKNLAGRLLSNSVAAAIGKFLLFIQHIALVPIFLAQWGADYYGEWLVISAIPSLLSMSDIGITTASVNKFILRYSDGEVRLATRAIVSAFIFLGLLLAAILVIEAIIFCFFSSVLLETNFVSARQQSLTIICLTIVVLCNLISSLTESVFRVRLKSHLSLHINSAYHASNIIVTAFVLWFGGGILTLAFCLMFASILFATMKNFYAFRILEPNLPWQQCGDFKADFLPSMSKGFYYSLVPLFQGFYRQGLLLVIRGSIGPGAVATFATMRTLLNAVTQLLGLVNQGFFPELQLAFAEKNNQRAKSIYRVALLLGGGGGLLGVLILGFAGDTIYSLWTKNQIEMPMEVWWILVVAAICNCFWWTSGMVFRAIDNPRPFSIAGLSLAITSIIASLLLTPRVGLQGPAIAVLVFEASMGIFVLIYVTRFFANLNPSQPQQTIEGNACLKLTTQAKMKLPE
jgi:O-antigen/teichoic acid export membrane protein